MNISKNAEYRPIRYSQNDRRKAYWLEKKGHSPSTQGWKFVRWIHSFYEGISSSLSEVDNDMVTA